jgi:hypothetical protein
MVSIPQISNLNYTHPNDLIKADILAKHLTDLMKTPHLLKLWAFLARNDTWK